MICNETEVEVEAPAKSLPLYSAVKEYVPTPGFQVEQVATPAVTGAALHPDMEFAPFLKFIVPVAVFELTVAVSVFVAPYTADESVVRVVVVGFEVVVVVIVLLARLAELVESEAVLAITRKL